jgi:GNAT superfamily N-acetyltransferase
LVPTSGARPYPADKLLATIEAGTVFMLRDGHTTAGTITLTPEAEEGLWTDEELGEPSMFINKLTVAREYAGQDLGGRLLDWAGDRAYRAGARWIRLDAWTTNKKLQEYYVEHGFTYIRTVRDGTAVNGGPLRVARAAGGATNRPRLHGQDACTSPTATGRLSRPSGHADSKRPTSPLSARST